MSRVLDGISAELRAFLEAQPVFFVATAPTSEAGHINCSPKGLDTFRVLDEQTVAYLDLTGSGIETVAHLRENSRITLMFCAFSGRPDIIRLYGRGRVVTADAPDAADRSPASPSTRSAVGHRRRRRRVSIVRLPCPHGRRPRDEL
jgi:predicted pyridoxine 5'-phosphate oxidase superfamily flavin-nucleotide-binding protein